MIAISRITRTSLNREWRIENRLLNKKEKYEVAVVKKEEEEEGMLVAGVVVEGSWDEAFSA